MVMGPKTSVSPYTWTMSKPALSSRSMMLGAGGAPAVVILMVCSSGWASGPSTMIEHTAGAPHRWVMPCSSNARQISSARTARKHTCVPPAAVTAHVVHHPLQWNMGRVHRYRVSPVKPLWNTSPRLFRYAPRWEYSTPLGLPVVPEV